MHVDLSGLRALVTGSTKGIGRAIAQKLASCGAEVAINGRKYEDVTRTIDHVRKHVSSAKLIAAPGDAGTAPGIAEIIRGAGDVDILVNNVGVFEIKDAFAIPDEDWRRMFEVNVRASPATTGRACATRALAASCSSPLSPACRFRPR